MKRTRSTDEQISFALQQVDHGTAVGELCRELCRKMCISEQTFYRWKKQYSGMGRWNYGA